MLAVCSSAQTGHDTTADFAAVRDGIDRCYDDLSGQGFRTLGVAYRDLGAVTATVHHDVERSENRWEVKRL